MDKQQMLHRCAMIGCMNEAEYKAPHPSLKRRKYFWFCLSHIRLYNKSWNYAKDFEEEDIEREIRLDTIGHRPTWPISDFGFDLKEPPSVEKHVGKDKEEERICTAGMYTARSSEAIKACGILELSRTFMHEDMKKQFTMLAKKYHPDTNAGKGDQMFKLVHQAYTTLKTLCKEDKVS